MLSIVVCKQFHWIYESSVDVLHCLFGTFDRFLVMGKVRFVWTNYRLKVI